MDHHHTILPLYVGSKHSSWSLNIMNICPFSWVGHCWRFARVDKRNELPVHCAAEWTGRSVRSLSEMIDLTCHCISSLSSSFFPWQNSRDHSSPAIFHDHAPLDSLSSALCVFRWSGWPVQLVTWSIHLDRKRLWKRLSTTFLSTLSRHKLLSPLQIPWP